MLPIEKKSNELVQRLLDSGAVYDLARDLVTAEEAQALVCFLRNAHIYRYPKADHTVDGIIMRGNKILLIKRGNPNDPYYDYWALPGGFMEIGESLEQAFCREMKEELGLDFDPENLDQGGTFSRPDRDPRSRVITTVFLVTDDDGEPVAGDDAKECGWFTLAELPKLAFDHGEIIHKVLRCEED